MICAEETVTAPVEVWNIPGMFRYYCRTHYLEVVNSDDKDKKAFIDYYKNETTRSWLCPEGIELYNRLTQKNLVSKMDTGFYNFVIPRVVRRVEVDPKIVL